MERYGSGRSGLDAANHGTRTLPCAGIIQIRFKGYFSPTPHEAISSNEPMIEITMCNAGPPR
jgi:hypothetical protein